MTDGDGEGDEDGDGDPEVLPVDANWYFFLFVCEHSILVPAPFAIPPWAPSELNVSQIMASTWRGLSFS